MSILDLRILHQTIFSEISAYSRFVFLERPLENIEQPERGMLVCFCCPLRRIEGWIIIIEFHWMSAHLQIGSRYTLLKIQHCTVLSDNSIHKMQNMQGCYYSMEGISTFDKLLSSLWCLLGVQNIYITLITFTNNVNIYCLNATKWQYSWFSLHKDLAKGGLHQSAAATK